MNIIFCYLYRYSAHFKEYHEVAFTNTGNIPLAAIEKIITAHLMQGRWFIPEAWGLPSLAQYSWQTSHAAAATEELHEFLVIKPLAHALPPDGDIAQLLQAIQAGAAITATAAK